MNATKDDVAALVRKSPSGAPIGYYKAAAPRRKVDESALEVAQACLRNHRGSEK